jgi:hypothetical protein
MWISILLKIIISFIIIFIAHHLFIYLKDNYSVKKTKDLVGSQIIKYKTILQNIQERDISNALVVAPSYSNPSNPSNPYYPSHQMDDLKDDLQNFLNENILSDIQL